MFPFVWRAYDTRGGNAASPSVGAHGVAIENLDPSGYVRVRGELWRAEVSEGYFPVTRGHGVRVLGRDGLTLFVRGSDADDEERPS
jgi:membrane-bound ClpP family serine protease